MFVYAARAKHQRSGVTHFCNVEPTGRLDWSLAMYASQSGSGSFVAAFRDREWPASRTYSGQAGGRQRLYSGLHVSVLCHAAAGPYGVHHHMPWQNGGEGSTPMDAGHGSVRVGRFQICSALRCRLLHAKMSSCPIPYLLPPGQPVRRHALCSSSFPCCH
jgi:hypothetical protein